MVIPSSRVPEVVPSGLPAKAHGSGNSNTEACKEVCHRSELSAFELQIDPYPTELKVTPTDRIGGKGGGW